MDGHTGGAATIISLWIYDQDTNQVNYLSADFPNTGDGPPGPFINGFREFNMLGDSASNAEGVDEGAQRLGAIAQQVILEKNRFYNFNKPDDVNAMWHRMNAMPGYKDPLGYYYAGTRDGNPPEDTEEHNRRITFRKTALIFSNRERSLLKWSAINNFSFPTLNIARLKEPISAIIPAPSFLKFTYANTFLVFTRNTIQRVQIYPDVGAITEDQAAETMFQNVISEQKNYGLLARDSLTLAGDSLYWLSEVGIVKWSGKGMEVISRNKITPQLLPYVYGFVNPVDNQYIVGVPPDYLIDYWSPGTPAPWEPPPGATTFPCCSCCVDDFVFAWHGVQHTGDNWLVCLPETQCKMHGGQYLNRMCEPYGANPWWLPPEEWAYHPCTSCDGIQSDGWNPSDWCAGTEFPHDEQPQPPVDPIPGCYEMGDGFSCVYSDISDPQVEQGFDGEWWGGRVCKLSTFWEQMQIENAHLYGLSGWPFSRYSEWGAGQWGAPDQNGYVFMNFLELDDQYPTGVGTIAFYDPTSSGVGGFDDDEDPIGSCAKFNVYYPTPPGFTELEGGRTVILNGKDLYTAYGSTLKYHPYGWTENQVGWHHKFSPNSEEFTPHQDAWRWKFSPFGGGMAVRVRDCPVPGVDGGILKWDGPRQYNTATSVYTREYQYPAGNYNSGTPFWWINTYIMGGISLIPFRLDESPYWGANRLGYNRGKNPYKGTQTTAGSMTRGKYGTKKGTRPSGDDLLYGEFYSHNLDNRKFTKYTGFNVQWSTIGKKLSGDIVNWVIDSDGKVMEWPGEAYVDYAVIRTKKFYVENASIRKLKIDYTGDSEVGVSVSTSGYESSNYTAEVDEAHSGGGIRVIPKHYDPMDKYLTTKHFSISNIQSNQWRGLALNKCTEFTLSISGPDAVNSIFYDIQLKSKINLPEQPTVTYEKEGYLDPVHSGRKKE